MRFVIKLELYSIMYCCAKIKIDHADTKMSIEFEISGPPVSSTNKTDSNDLTETVLKVALSIIKQTNTQTSIKFPYNISRFSILLVNSAFSQNAVFFILKRFKLGKTLLIRSFSFRTNIISGQEKAQRVINIYTSIYTAKRGRVQNLQIIGVHIRRGDYLLPTKLTTIQVNL
jgi:hypothetical protein